MYVDPSLSDLRVLLTSLLTARIVWPTRPPTHRGRKRTWRPDQRDQLGETEEGRRIDTPIERHKPICKCWMAFGYHLRRRTFRLRNAEDSYIARNRRRHCECSMIKSRNPATMLMFCSSGRPCTRSTTACRQRWPPSWRL